MVVGRHQSAQGLRCPGRCHRRPDRAGIAARTEIGGELQRPARGAHHVAGEARRLTGGRLVSGEGGRGEALESDHDRLDQGKEQLMAGPPSPVRISRPVAGRDRRVRRRAGTRPGAEPHHRLQPPAQLVPLPVVEVGAVLEAVLEHGAVGQCGGVTEHLLSRGRRPADAEVVVQHRVLITPPAAELRLPTVQLHAVRPQPRPGQDLEDRGGRVVSAVERVGQPEHVLALGGPCRADRLGQVVGEEQQLPHRAGTCALREAGSGKLPRSSLPFAVQGQASIRTYRLGTMCSGSRGAR